MAYDYDLITVGGGLAGSTLARSLAANGARVLVLEREHVFRDRVRGELVHPWGVAEARRLRVYDLLKQTCGYEVRFRASQISGAPTTAPRDLVATTPQRAGSLHFPHPAMQQVLLDSCMQAGATVLRGARVEEVVPGLSPTVCLHTAEGERVVRARLVVGADGRVSSCRKWGGFEPHRDLDRMVIAGVLLNGLSAPEDTISVFINPSRSEVAFVLPLGGTRFRCYNAFHQAPDRVRLGGPEAVPAFIEQCISAGAPREWFSAVQVVGPLASFSCAESWIPHPYRLGMALVGDAAATSDPTFGCGLSLTLRDARVLGDLLIEESDWDAAAHAYAEQHDRYFATLHRLLGWMVQLFYEPGPDAAARRERALARIAADPSCMPDIIGLGPECPSSEAAYFDLFGEGPVL